LVDGGITDNLGLLAIYEMVEVAGGAKQFLDYIGGKPSPHFVVISLNPSTTPVVKMELSNKIPTSLSLDKKHVDWTSHALLDTF